MGNATRQLAAGFVMWVPGCLCLPRDLEPSFLSSFPSGRGEILCKWIFWPAGGDRVLLCDLWHSLYLKIHPAGAQATHDLWLRLGQ